MERKEPTDKRARFPHRACASDAVEKAIGQIQSAKRPLRHPVVRLAAAPRWGESSIAREGGFAWGSKREPSPKGLDDLKPSIQARLFLIIFLLKRTDGVGERRVTGMLARIGTFAKLRDLRHLEINALESLGGRADHDRGRVVETKPFGIALADRRWAPFIFSRLRPGDTRISAFPRNDLA